MKICQTDRPKNFFKLILINFLLVGQAAKSMANLGHVVWKWLAFAWNLGRLNTSTHLLWNLNYPWVGLGWSLCMVGHTHLLCQRGPVRTSEIFIQESSKKQYVVQEGYRVTVIAKLWSYRSLCSRMGRDSRWAGLFRLRFFFHFAEGSEQGLNGIEELTN